MGNFCPDDSENNKSIVNEWCVGPGTKPKLEVGKDMFDKAKGVAGKVTGAIDKVTGAAEGIVNTAQDTFDSVQDIFDMSNIIGAE